MSKKLTRWFPHHIKPARDGAYEVRFDGNGGGQFAYFCKGRWGYGTYTIAEAESVREILGMPANQEKQWRGLAKKPSSASKEVA